MRSIVLDNEAIQALTNARSPKHRAVVAINRFPIRDHMLDSPSADVAAQIQSATPTGVADAHIGATVRSLSSTEVVVLTSDPADIAAVCSPSPVTIVNV